MLISMGLRDRILRLIGVPTEPQHVEKAPRRERWKRQAWMFISTVISFCLVVLPVLALNWTLNLSLGPVAYVVGAIVGIGFISLDAYVVFPWGVDRFDLVLPWQFRDEKAKKGRQA